MLEDYNLVVTQFVTLWAVLEPISHLTLFLATTGDMTSAQRRKVAVLCGLFAFIILVFFIIAGRALLNAMGISVLSFQIAGGIILFLYAISMIFSDPKPGPAVEAGSDKHIVSIAVYPLAMPLIAGPGSILTVVILADNNRNMISYEALTIAVVAALMVIMVGLFWLGEYIIRFIGSAGSSLLRRIMGLVLAALSVDIVLTAMSKWLNLPAI